MILKLEAYEAWIDEETQGKALMEILRDKVMKDFAVRPVSKPVNADRNNAPDLIMEVQAIHPGKTVPAGGGGASPAFRDACLTHFHKRENRRVAPVMRWRRGCFFAILGCLQAKLRSRMSP